MKLQTIRIRFRAVVFAALTATVFSLPKNLNAEPENGDLASTGLVMHWEANIGGASLANGPQSFVLWPHTTEKREYVTVRSNGRIIQRIDSSEVDTKALEDAIVRDEKLLKSPRIGLDGAKSKAQKLVATYKTLGRNVEVESFSQRLVYAITLTNNGIIEAFDAETGAILWRTEVGRSSLSMFGPGVSDDYVAVTNGNTFYVLELKTGSVVTSRKLAFTPTACPAVLQGKLIVPSIDGRLVSYDIKNELLAPTIIRTGTENRLGLTISANQQILSWPTGDRLLQARMEKALGLWTSTSLNESLLSLPVATQQGFVASTVQGTVFHCPMTREDTVLWKKRLAAQVTKSPILNKDMAFVLTDEGFLFALKLADGSDAWGHQPRNIRNMIAVGKEHVYVKDTRNTLVAIELSTGNESGRINSIFPDAIPNTINDRLFFITKQGQVTCLRETNAVEPTFAIEYSGVVAPASTKPTTPTQEPAKPMESDTNVFGDSAPAMDAADPFGTDPF